MLSAFKDCEYIDISQSISTESACFPGDTPFSFEVTMSLAESKIANVSSFTMSPHVGTHADAPNHMEGDLRQPHSSLSIGFLPLKPYVGPVTVIDLVTVDGAFSGAITLDRLLVALDGSTRAHERVLFKTRLQSAQPSEPIFSAHRSFDTQYAYFSADAIEHLASLNVKLVGIDTPSVDALESDALDVHHLLLKYKMYWLENLDLTRVEAGDYCLLALPLKFTELEASPVRAVLLSSR